jgi:hypothetical protein
VARELTPDAVMASVERRMGGAFVWGICDCTRAAGAVFADLHGFDPTADLAGRYDDARSAARLARGGLAAAAQVLADRHGLRPVDAQPGAIGIVQHGGRQAAAICVAPGHWAVKSEQGFGIVAEAVSAWSI